MLILFVMYYNAVFEIQKLQESYNKTYLLLFYCVYLDIIYQHSSIV